MEGLRLGREEGQAVEDRWSNTEHRTHKHVTVCTE